MHPCPGHRVCRRASLLFQIYEFHPADAAPAEGFGSSGAGGRVVSDVSADFVSCGCLSRKNSGGNALFPLFPLCALFSKGGAGTALPVRRFFRAAGRLHAGRGAAGRGRFTPDSGAGQKGAAGQRRRSGVGRGLRHGGGGKGCLRASCREPYTGLCLGGRNLLRDAAVF